MHGKSERSRRAEHVSTAIGAAGRIAIVRALRGLGDMLCIVPALRALRNAAPRAHITLIGLAEQRSFLERYDHYVDELLPFPGFPGIPERPYSALELSALLAQIHTNPFDLAIQMHGAGTVSNAFTALLSARVTAGLFRPPQSCPAPETYFRYPEHGSEIHRWMYLVEALGCRPRGDAIDFPLTANDHVAYQVIAQHFGLAPRRYAVVHPGAQDLSRRWPPACFAQVGDALIERGVRVVLTGTAAESTTVAEVARHMRHSPCDLAGRTTLGAMGALLADAALLVSNDTGVSHLAAALRTPSVVVFMASDPERWAPLDRIKHRHVRPAFLRSATCQRSRPARTATKPVLDHAFALLEARN